MWTNDNQFVLYPSYSTTSWTTSAGTQTYFQQQAPARAPEPQPTNVAWLKRRVTEITDLVAA